MRPMGGKFVGEPDNGWMLCRDRMDSAYSGSVYPTREAAIDAAADDLWNLGPFELYWVGRVEGDEVLKEERLVLTTEQIAHRSEQR